MKFNILTIPESPRIQSLLLRLRQSEIGRYELFYGTKTRLRYDDLFKNIKTIIAQNYDSPYALLLEDDVLFSNSFSLSHLEDIIKESVFLNADMVLGGIKDGSRIHKVSDNILSLHNYSGSHFQIIFKKFYDLILKAHIDQEFELFCSHNAQINKFVTFPFLAYQTDGPSRFLPYTSHKKDYVNFENHIKNQLKIDSNEN